MTPDKDGYLYWQPGDPKPDADAICDAEWRLDADWEPKIWERLTNPPKWLSHCQYRYRLRTQPIDLSSIKPGDTVTLKSGPYEVTAADGESVDLGEGYTVSGNMISTHTPQPKSRVTDKMVYAAWGELPCDKGASVEHVRQALEAALAVKEEGE